MRIFFSTVYIRLSMSRTLQSTMRQWWERAKEEKKRTVVCAFVHTSRLSNTQLSIINKWKIANVSGNNSNEYKHTKKVYGSIECKSNSTLFFQLPIFTDDEWFICSIHVALILNEIEEVACRWLLYLHQCVLQIDMNSIKKNSLTIEHLYITNEAYL